jgi:hypothetical protein
MRTILQNSKEIQEKMKTSYLKKIKPKEAKQTTWQSS